MFFLKIVIFGIIGLGVTYGSWIVLLAFQGFIIYPVLEFFGSEGLLKEGAEISLWIAGFFGFATFISLFFIGPIFRRIMRKKFCAWCGKKSGLTKEKEEASNYIWRYPNADGSEDKRKKNNFQRANYFTFWRCKKCSALTRFQHNISRNPSSSVEVIQVMLSEDGEGERTAKDWTAKGVHSVSGVRE